MKKWIPLFLAVLVPLSILSCGGGTSDAGTMWVPTGDEPPANRTWISPGKVTVSNFYPGAQAEYAVTIHNGNDYSAAFSVTYRVPDHVDGGYNFPPAECADWVIIADGAPLLQPYDESGSTQDITVTLAMPKGAEAPDKWEFWISVIDASQMGMVRTEMCVRWLIIMR